MYPIDRKSGRPSVEPDEKKISKSFTIKRKVIDDYIAYCIEHGKDHNQLIEDFMVSIFEGNNDEDVNRLLMEKIKLQINELQMQYDKLEDKIAKSKIVCEEHIKKLEDPKFIEAVHKFLAMQADSKEDEFISHLNYFTNRCLKDFGIPKDSTREYVLKRRS